MGIIIGVGVLMLGMIVLRLHSIHEDLEEIADELKRTH